MRWPDFEAYGFDIVGNEPTPRTHGTSAADPIRLLESYGPMGIRFCPAWDDAVRVTRDRRTFTAFGTCPFGVFLRDDDSGSVVLFALDRVTFTSDLVPINLGFPQFVSCHSAFLAAVFMAKSRAAAEAGLAYLTDCAEWLAEQVRAHDAEALAEGTFWDHLIYYLDDNGVPLRPRSRFESEGG